MRARIQSCHPVTTFRRALLKGFYEDCGYYLFRRAPRCAYHVRFFPTLDCIPNCATEASPKRPSAEHAQTSYHLLATERTACRSQCARVDYFVRTLATEVPMPAGIKCKSLWHLGTTYAICPWGVSNTGVHEGYATNMYAL